MPKHIIIVDGKSDYLLSSPDCLVVNVSDYINSGLYPTKDWKMNNKFTRIINLCNDCSYLTAGYYVSLLAEARGQKVIPSVNVLLDLNWKRLYKIVLTELSDLLDKLYSDEENKNPHEFFVFLGRTQEEQLKYVARKIFDEFRSPILCVKISYHKKWRIDDVEAVPIKKLNDLQRGQFAQALAKYSRSYWNESKSKKIPKYWLGVLVNHEEKMPPSSPKTISKFIKIAETMDIGIDLLSKKDFARIPEYDGIFIRETTAVDNHTYRFIKRAESEGLAMIDDSKSLMKCDNKVYLAELLQANKINTPHTIIFDKYQYEKLKEQITFPQVLKIPNGAYSQGIYKANNHQEFLQFSQKLFKDSDIILAQEFIKTDFDWRIGILDNKPLFACKYFMAKDHWQIIKNHENGTEATSGEVQGVAISEVPEVVLETALRTAQLIGNGLYGVDLKQDGDKTYVMEINDNPSIDIGDEDAILKDDLYKKILQEFIRRIEN